MGLIINLKHNMLNGHSKIYDQNNIYKTWKASDERKQITFLKNLDKIYKTKVWLH